MNMKRELKSCRGAAIVEFAIILPLLFMLILGIIEFGLLLYNKAIITNASREGARAGVVFNVNGSGTYSPLSGGEIRAVINSYTSNHLVTFGAPPDPPDVTPCASRGSDLTVTITYPYTFLAFSNLAKLVGGGTFPGTITLSSQAVMRCE